MHLCRCGISCKPPLSATRRSASTMIGSSRASSVSESELESYASPASAKRVSLTCRLETGELAIETIPEGISTRELTAEKEPKNGCGNTTHKKLRWIKFRCSKRRTDHTSKNNARVVFLSRYALSQRLRTHHTPHTTSLSVGCDCSSLASFFFQTMT